MKPQHIIWALAGGAILLALAAAAWHGNRSDAQVGDLVPPPAAVHAAANQSQWPTHPFAPATASSATSRPGVVPAAAPAATPTLASPPEATTPAADNPVSSPPPARPDVDALDPAAQRDRAAEHGARAR